MSFLNVRETFWDFLISKNRISDEDTGFIIQAAEKLSQRKIKDRLEAFTFLSKYEGKSFDFERIYDALMQRIEVNDWDLFLQNEKSPHENICDRCNKPYSFAGVDPFINNIWEDREHICSDCFVQEIQQRELTAAEIESLARYIIQKEDYRDYSGSSYYYDIFLPDEFTQAQKEQVQKRVENIKQQRREKQEQEIRKKYLEKAKDMYKLAGYGEVHDDQSNKLLSLISVLLRYIDDSCNHSFNLDTRYC